VNGPVDDEVLCAVGAALDEVRARHGVRIGFAVESGSRAWGFPSPDSDYDVRFVYVQPLEWYLRVFQGRDTIEAMLPGDLDLAGWDLRKALGLLGRCNVALFEQLGSPIVYCEDGLRERLRSLAPAFFDPKAAGHHYAAMARRAAEGVLDRAGGELIGTKKLFYLLRPLCAFRWIVVHGAMPPTRLQDMLSAIDVGSDRTSWIEDWIEQKARANERDPIVVSNDALAWLRAELDWVDAERNRLRALSRPGTDALDAALRAELGIEG